MAAIVLMSTTFITAIIRPRNDFDGDQGAVHLDLSLAGDLFSKAIRT
jgi:hypothetical protein